MPKPIAFTLDLDLKKAPDTKLASHPPSDPQQDSEPQPANRLLAIFDLFGVSPKFYFDGKTRTHTWIGFFCSIFYVGLILLLLAIQIIQHSEKQESLVNSYETQVKGHEMLNMAGVN